MRRKAHGRGQAGRRQWGLGYTYIHSAVDDCSRLAYSEVLGDERARTAVGFWHRAQVWFADQGVVVRALLTDIQTRCISLRSLAEAPAHRR